MTRMRHEAEGAKLHPGKCREFTAVVSGFDPSHFGTILYIVCTPPPFSIYPFSPSLLFPELNIQHVTACLSQVAND